MKTAVSRGTGAWGELNATYRRYAESVRFHVVIVTAPGVAHLGAKLLHLFLGRPDVPAAAVRLSARCGGTPPSYL